MNQLEKYIVDLLQHRLYYRDKEVQVTKHLSNKPVLPVITLDLSSGVSSDKIFVKLTSKQTFIYRRKAVININLWCNSEDERESLTEQIMHCFFLEQSYNYNYCTKYNEGSCLSTGTECQAINNPKISGYGGKCPEPDELGYESISDKHDIIAGTLNIEPPFQLDELNEKPPILRNIFKCECSYYEFYNTDEIRINNIEFDVENN